jgi:hypothetical protein
MKYTDSMISEMRSIGRFDLAVASEFATKHKLPVRSVIAKTRALNLPYDTKDPKQAKVRGRDKTEIVAAIQAAVGETLTSLSKMTAADLEKLEKAVS